MNHLSLTDELLAQLQGAPLERLSQQLGTSGPQTASAVGAALPLLLGALGRNASQPQGADALFGALQRDHGGGLDLGNVLGSVLGGAASGSGIGGSGGGVGGILGHVFGGQRANAEHGLGQATGLGGAQAGQLLAMLAPLVMSFLANRANQHGLDAGGLGQILGQERAQVQQQGGVAGGLLGSLLDQDGDGQFGIGDIVKIGTGLLGGRR